MPPAKRADKPGSIHLRSRRITPRPGVAPKLAKQAERRDGTMHAIVQPAQPVDARTRARWAKEPGIRLLDPIPDGAYFASVPADAERLRGLVRNDGPLRWVGPIELADKLSEPLAAGEVPDHARGDEGVRVVVLFFGDVPVRAQQRVLKPFAADAPRRVEPLNGWQVEVGEKDLRRLAAEDEVKWIEEVPPPIELDNDGVRSGTALEADPVLAAPYGLTGAGVTLAQWEDTHASLTHDDYAGRIVLADGPLAVTERTALHAETTADGIYTVGEAIYVDMDDSATVSAGDVRVTAVGMFAAGSTVAPGDADAGTALVTFAANELFTDDDNDGRYAPGHGLYRDVDNSGTVTAGDVRLVPVGAFPAGSVVAGGDADAGRALWPMGDPHYHSTHCAGTVIGDGTASAANGGGANQWKGVAPGATLRSYVMFGALDPDYVDAAANGTTISTNSWGFTHMHQVASPAASYSAATALYDAVVSGRRSDGTPSGLAAPITIVGSAGNAGRPERHTENVGVNGQFDNGESIYVDGDDSGTVTAHFAEVRVGGPAQPIGTVLVPFREDERHDETGGQGTYQSSEAIYRDVDASGTVTVGDVRLTPPAGFAVGSVVAAGDSDLGRPLRHFRFWRTVRVPNSAKDTVVVANITSDTAVPSASTSRGPTLDGRVKPDIAGPGSQAAGDFAVTSTQPRDTYGGLTGTSMSTPAVAGALALVTERYRQLCGGATPPPHALRALLVHGAADLTAIPHVGTGFGGPDYTHGYGRARVKQSVELIPHHRQGSAAALGDIDHPITIGAVSGLKVTLVWDDPAWTSNAAPSPTTGFLQNDLDLVLIGPDGTQYTPWLLDPANPAQPATRGIFAMGVPIPASARDRRNTVEQVVVDSAAAGTWTIRVTASTLNLGPQPYTVVCEFLPPQDSPCAALPATDVWMRDNATDTGTVPSGGTMYLSPDLWNRLAADGGGGGVHLPPEYGQTNYLYATLRNASGVTAQAVSIDVWLAPASTGLAWPASFTYVGRIPVANVPTGAQTVGPLPWLPPSPVPSSHFCFYVRVVSPQDPVTFAETANVSANASNSNNLVWRNVNVVDDVTTTDVSFVVRNIEEKDAEVELVFTAPPEVLRRGELALRLPRAFEQRLGPRTQDMPGLAPPDPVEAARFVRRGGRGGLDVEPVDLPAPRRVLLEPEVRLPAVELAPGEAHAMTLTFGPTANLEREVEVDVAQVVRGEVVGGIRYVLRPRHGDQPR